MSAIHSCCQRKLILALFCDGQMLRNTWIFEYFSPFESICCGVLRNSHAFIQKVTEQAKEEALVQGCTSVAHAQSLGPQRCTEPSYPGTHVFEGFALYRRPFCLLNRQLLVGRTCDFSPWWPSSWILMCVEKYVRAFDCPIYNKFSLLMV